MTQLLNRTTGAIADFPASSVDYWLSRGWELATAAFSDLNPHIGDVLTLTADGWKPVTPPATTVSHFGRVVSVATTDAMRQLAQSPDVTVAVLPAQTYVLPGNSDPSVLGNWLQLPFGSATALTAVQQTLTALLNATAGRYVAADSTGYPANPQHGDAVWDESLGYTLERTTNDVWRRPSRWLGTFAPLVGSVPAKDPEVVSIAGEVTISTNGNGDWSLDLPKPFPNALLSVQMMLSANLVGADFQPFGNLNFTINRSATTLGSVKGRLFAPANGTPLANVSIKTLVLAHGC